MCEKTHKDRKEELYIHCVYVCVCACVHAQAYPYLATDSVLPVLPTGMLIKLRFLYDVN